MALLGVQVAGRLLAALFFVVTIGCSSSDTTSDLDRPTDRERSESAEETTLLRAAPSCSPETARALLTANGRFHALADSMGFASLLQLEDELRRSFLRGDSRAVRSTVESAWLQVATALDSLHEVGGTDLELSVLRSLNDAEAAEVVAWQAKRDSLLEVRQDPNGPGNGWGAAEADAYFAVLDSLALAFEEIGWLAEAARTRNEVQSMRRSSDEDRSAAHAALRVSKASRRSELVCDALGRLALRYASGGPPDSVTFYMDESIELALRKRFPVRAAALTYAYSHYFYRQGREGLAAELRDAAVEYCRELGGGAEELTYLSGAMSIHSSYGNWELVDRDRLRALSLSGGETPAEFRIYEARTLLFRGDVDSASALFRLEHERSPEDLVTLEHWAQGLLDHVRADEALEVIGRGLALTDDGYHGLFANRFRALAAAAHLDLGDVPSARRALRDLVGGRSQRGDPWMRFHHAILETRVLVQEADTVAARERLQIAERELQAVESIDTSGSGRHVARQKARLLRSTRRELAGIRPARSYAASFDDPTTASRVRDRVTGSSGCHLFFDEDDGSLLRWTASASGVTCDTLGSAREVYARVRSAAEAMSRDPGEVSTVSVELGEVLTELGRILLPPDMHSNEGEGPRDLLLTARGALRLLPFEVLGTSDRAYRPLLLDADVSYLRATRDPHGPVDELGRRERVREGRGLIVADPTISHDLARRYPGLRGLQGGRAEVRHLRTLRPHCRMLAGDDATRSGLFAEWEGASFLYFASHVVRDPENPFWTFLPLAPAAEGGDPAQTRLEVIDILEADLRGCPLVVLSGCGSGMPHVTSSNVAPSLADAFLDAGAAAVVQTFWKVGDDEAAALMQRFQERWLAEGEDPVTALHRARREQWHAGSRHPFTWGAFGIQLRSP